MNVSLRISLSSDTYLANKLMSLDGALRDDLSNCMSIALESRSLMMDVRVVCVCKPTQMGG